MDNNVDVSVVLPILKKIPLFANLDEQYHREIIQHIVLMYYPENYQLFKEGDEGDALYIIKKGVVEIFHPADNPVDEKHVAQINDGGFFGEMALVSEAQRNASARTKMESEIFILSKQDFKKLLDTNPALAEQVSATMVARIKDNNSKEL